MLTNPCFMYLATRFVYYIFTVYIIKPYSHLTKIFYQQTFNTILKLTGAYNMSLKATKSDFDFRSKYFNQNRSLFEDYEDFISYEVC